MKHIVATALALMPLLAATAARADDFESSKVMHRDSQYSIDIQPLSLLLDAGLAPNLNGGVAAIGAEAAVARQIGLFANLGYGAVHLTDSQLQKAEDANSDPVPRRDTSMGLELGSRFYFNSSTDDSWFGSLSASATRSMAEWAYGDQRVNEDSWAVAPTLEGGYRWLWNNGLLVRVGAGVRYALLTTRDFSAASAISGLGLASAVDTDPTETKVRHQEDTHPLVPVLDLALGFAF